MVGGGGGGERCDFVWSPLYSVVTDSQWISVSAKKRGSVLKGNSIICIKNYMLFLDMLAKMYSRDEENIEVRLQYITVKSKWKWYSFVWNVLVFKWFESQTVLMNGILLGFD